MKQLLSAPSLLAFALAGLGALAAITSARAGERDVAEVFLSANGAEQRIEVDLGALQPGQSRQLFTDAGLPAIVSRSEQGLQIELAGESHAVPMPQVLHFQQLGASGEAGEKRAVVIKRERSGDAAGEARHEVRIVRLGDAAEASELDIDALVAEALAGAEAEGLDLGEGEGRKVRVVRRIERASAD